MVKHKMFNEAVISLRNVRLLDKHRRARSGPPMYKAIMLGFMYFAQWRDTITKSNSITLSRKLILAIDIKQALEEYEYAPSDELFEKAYTNFTTILDSEMMLEDQYICQRTYTIVISYSKY